MIRHSLVLAALAFTFASPPAQAYVPPAEYIVKKFVRMRTGIETIWVKSKVSAVVDGETTGIHFFDVTSYDPATQIVQSLAFDEENKLVYAKSVKVTQSSEGQSVASATSAIPTYMLFVDNPSYFIQSLTSFGIPIRVEPENYEPVDFSQQIKTAKAAVPEGQEFDPRPLVDLVPTPTAEDTRIQRWKDTLAWVLGRPGGSGTRQLWIEKDSFLPIRFVIGEGREVQFEKYRFMKNYPYPAAITFHQDNEAVLIAELTKVVINAPQKEPARKLADGFTDEDVSGRVKTLIEQFYSEVR